MNYWPKSPWARDSAGGQGNRLHPRKERNSPSRSRSPLNRKVKFANPLENEIRADAEDQHPHWIRMKDAREAVPRLSSVGEPGVCTQEKGEKAKAAERK